MTCAFLAIHVGTGIVDPFTSLGLTAALIPFSSPYKTFWLGLGVIAMYLLMAVIVTSLLRPLLGAGAWRTVHWITYALWPVAFVHGVMIGTDRNFSWMLVIDGACVVGMVLALLSRLRRPSPTSWRALPEGQLKRGVIQ